MPAPAAPSWNIAVIGAGPAGLALALEAARRMPAAQLTVFDARPLDRDVAGDPRTLALALGSVQLLRQLGAWPDGSARPIEAVHVSQAPPTLALGGQPAEVWIEAREQAVPMLGAVLSYGALVSRLQQAWMQRQAAEPDRLRSRFGQPVARVQNRAGLGNGSGSGSGNSNGAGSGGGSSGVEVEAGGNTEAFDLAVVAEGGVFAEQARKAITHDYRQAAWVGEVLTEGGRSGLAVERFTRQGPVALLPLPPRDDTPAGQQRAALVWCVPDADDPVGELDPRQRATVLNSLLPEVAGRVQSVGTLKRFALGLNAERTLVDGAVVRIGNAAQTLHPVAGQGLNLGLRDACVLVQALKGAPDRSPAALRQALRRVEWQRGPDRWATIATTDFLARSFTWRWPGLPAARGLGLALLDRLGPAKSLLARQMMFGRR